MKKQLLMLILAAGLIDGSVQAVGSKDLINAVAARDADKLAEILENYYEQNIAEQDYIQDLQRLLASGVNVSDNVYGYDSKNSNRQFSIPAIDMLLLFSVDGQLYKAVKFLLDNGANVNIQEPSEEADTPLLFAADRADSAMIELLLAYGADIDFSISVLKKQLQKADKDKDDRSRKCISCHGIYIQFIKSFKHKIKLLESYKNK